MTIIRQKPGTIIVAVLLGCLAYVPLERVKDFARFKYLPERLSSRTGAACSRLADRSRLLPS